MPLAAGTRLGSYVIDAPIGAGGMGEVYRARDTALQRDVAIKILPEVFAADPERLARFSREAQTLAALNHPNIAQIYGLEATALIMELVDGLTLAETIAGGADAGSSRTPRSGSAGGTDPRVRSHGMPLDLALPIARQIADALEAAHGQGIVHRDLKPANVKVRPDGTVKVLDFGLAKFADAPGTRDVAPATPSDSGLTFRAAITSPTFTNAAMTHAGMILGTAAYMAPEQAKGRSVDKRADIWAFGCVLFEMLAGKMAFPGEDVTETLAAVVRGEPNWTALPTDTPASVQRLLRRCLTKDVKERLSDIGVARLEIRDALDQPDAIGPAPGVREPRRSKNAWWLSAAALTAGALVTALGAWMLWPPAPPASPMLSLMLDWPDGLTWIGPSGPGITISPDGSHIGYVALKDERAARLFVHALDSDQSHEVAGSERAYSPFFSPDGTEIGFIASGKLWRAPVAGGTPFEIGTIDQSDRGVAWSADGYIYSGGGNGLSRIAVSGGTRESLTTVNRAGGEIAHRFPAVVPGGRGILFTLFKGGLNEARLAVFDLTTRTSRVLMERTGHDAQYASTGHLVFLRTGVVMAVPFDAARLEVTGAPAPVLNGVAFNNGGAAHFALAGTGTLVYLPDPTERAPAHVMWVDRAGRLTPTEVPPGPYREPRLSPDGTRLALSRFESLEKISIVVWDFGRRALTTITRDTGLSTSPAWTPDGESLVYAYRPHIGDVARMFRQRADGGGNPVQLSSAPLEQTFGSSGEFPGSLSPDGTKLFYSQEATTADGVKSLELATSRIETIDAPKGGSPRISPDGRWLTYPSLESGLSEIIVRPYPAVTTGRWQISSGGSRWQRWSRDGRELFYRGTGANLSRVYVVRADSAEAFRTARPQVLFELPEAAAGQQLFGDFDVAPDGRFAMLVVSQPRAPTPHVIVNWFEALKRAAPR